MKMALRLVLALGIGAVPMILACGCDAKVPANQGTASPVGTAVDYTTAESFRRLFAIASSDDRVSLLFAAERAGAPADVLKEAIELDSRQRWIEVDPASGCETTLFEQAVMSCNFAWADVVCERWPLVIAEPGWFGHPPLVAASIAGDTRVLEYLLAKGAAVDSVTVAVNRHVGEAVINGTGGLTALTYAVMGGHVEAVELLLRKGANPRLGAGGQDAFWAMRNHPGEKERERIRLLLERATK